MPRSGWLALGAVLAAFGATQPWLGQSWLTQPVTWLLLAASWLGVIARWRRRGAAAGSAASRRSGSQTRSRLASKALVPVLLAGAGGLAIGVRLLFSTAGQPANFDPAQGYVWPIVRPRSNASAANPTNVTPINTVAQIDIFDTGTNATVPLTVANLNAYLQFDASQFNFGATPAAQQGTFAFALMPDALGNANRVIAVTYTPVPEPAALVA